jgi:hypothetical protein
MTSHSASEASNAARSSGDHRDAIVPGSVEAIDAGDDARGAGGARDETLRAVVDLRRRHADAVGLQAAHGAERLLHERQSAR